MDDHALLREFLEHHSEKAFSELVERHLPLVYGTALRLVGDSHAAQDVAQAVFIQLARKAWTIRNGHALPGWLYRATRHAAYAALRGEIRRRARETAAMNLSEQNHPARSIAEQIAPLLDEAMGCLSRVEQDALLLRYFQDKNFHEVGAALGLNEDAARKRTDRALDKIRRHFSRRGITATAALLGSAITTHAATSPPVGLAAKVSGVSFNGTTTAGTSGLREAMKAFLFMSTKTKIVSAVVLIALLALVSLSVQWEKAAPPSPPPMPVLAQAPLTFAKVPAVAAPVVAPVPASGAAPLVATPQNTFTPDQFAAMQQIRLQSRGKAVTNNLHQFATAAEKYMANKGATSVGYADLVGQGKYIRNLPTIMGEDYTHLTIHNGDTEVEVVFPDGTPYTYDFLPDGSPASSN